MIIIFSVILCLLGLLGAKSLITLKLPAFRGFLDKLVTYQEMLGILGMVFGFAYLIRLLDMISLLRLVPGHFLLAVASVFVSLGLGVLFGLDAIRRNLKNTDYFLFRKVEQLRLFTLRYQKQFGVAGVVLGLITFFDMI